MPGGRGSMQALAAELAARLPVARLPTDICAASAEQYNLGWRAAGRATASDVGFVRTLAAVPGIVHLPSHHLARYAARRHAPFVVTVHDLIRQFDRRRRAPLIHRPTARDRLVLALDVAGIRRASAVIAVSESTKHDLVAHLRLPAARIRVIHPGIDLRRFRRVAAAALPYPYLLFVGSEHPRKNLPALLEALAGLKRDPRYAALKLVKVGAAGGAEAPFGVHTAAAVARLGVARDVHLAGHVSHDRLVALYSGARCLVLPSLYEGFGLPPLEAMACGCPVIVSDRGALPEIAGPAALVSRPTGPALELALRAVLDDDVLRARLRALGLAHAARFAWERAAADTLEVYEQVRRAAGGAPRWQLGAS